MVRDVVFDRRVRGAHLLRVGNCVRRETSSRSCLTSENEIPAAVGAGSEMLATVGVATSINLLASLASFERSVQLSIDARTILMFAEVLKKEFA